MIFLWTWLLCCVYHFVWHGVIWPNHNWGFFSFFSPAWPLTLAQDLEICRISRTWNFVVKFWFITQNVEDVLLFKARVYLADFPPPPPFFQLSWCFHTRARQRQDNEKTNVEPVHSYDAFHTRSVLSLSCSGVKTVIVTSYDMPVIQWIYSISRLTQGSTSTEDISAAKVCQATHNSSSRPWLTSLMGRLPVDNSLFEDSHVIEEPEEVLL